MAIEWALITLTIAIYSDSAELIILALLIAIFSTVANVLAINWVWWIIF
jgi:hypothetical protein